MVNFESRSCRKRAAIGKQGKRSKIDEKIVNNERQKDFKLDRTRRFLYRTRYFTDSGIIATKDFVKRTYRRMQDRFKSNKDKGAQAHRRARRCVFPKAFDGMTVSGPLKKYYEPDPEK